MLARSGMIGLMAFANKIECEQHQLERPRPRAHALQLTGITGTTGISRRYNQSECAASERCLLLLLASQGARAGKKGKMRGLKSRR